MHYRQDAQDKTVAPARALGRPSQSPDSQTANSCPDARPHIIISGKTQTAATWCTSSMHWQNRAAYTHDQQICRHQVQRQMIQMKAYGRSSSMPPKLQLIVCAYHMFSSMCPIFSKLGYRNERSS